MCNNLVTISIIYNPAIRYDETPVRKTMQYTIGDKMRHIKKATRG